MDITVYLPDEIGEWAKEATPKLNLSAMLRHAVENERDRRAAIAESTAESELHELDVVEGEDGPSYKVRLHGTEIAYSGAMEVGVTFYLTEAGELVLYESVNDFDPHGPSRGRLYRACGVEALRARLDDEAYIKAMAALGEGAVIDIGKAS